jgi:hypothetical protein
VGSTRWLSSQVVWGENEVKGAKVTGRPNCKETLSGIKHVENVYCKQRQRNYICFLYDILQMTEYVIDYQLDDPF